MLFLGEIREISDIMEQTDPIGEYPATAVYRTAIDIMASPSTRRGVDPAPRIMAGQTRLRGGGVGEASGASVIRTSGGCIRAVEPNTV
jgi:hypothetical protein